MESETKSTKTFLTSKHARYVLTWPNLDVYSLYLVYVCYNITTWMNYDIVSLEKWLADFLVTGTIELSVQIYHTSSLKIPIISSKLFFLNKVLKGIFVNRASPSLNEMIYIIIMFLTISTLRRLLFNKGLLDRLCDLVAHLVVFLFLEFYYF